MNQTSCQRAFANGFHDEPAGNIMAFSDHTQNDCKLTLREYVEHYLLANRVDAEGWWTLKQCMFIKKGACAEVEDSALHLESKFGHAPKSAAFGTALLMLL